MTEAANVWRGGRCRCRAKLVLAGGAVLFLAGCALAPYEDDSAVKQVATLVRVATPVSEPAAFVREQRPQQPGGYLPVGVTPPERSLRPRDAAGAKALEASLEADRKASQTFVNRPLPNSAHDGSKPGKSTPNPNDTPSE